MVEQEDIIALTKHVRSFSDALNNLRNSFKDSLVDGIYNHHECQNRTHLRLSNVLKILKGVLAKYPPLHSPDILSAAGNIINKIKTYNYADGEEGPPDFYGAIDQLALSFSSSVSDFLMGEKDIGGSPYAQIDQDDDNDDAEEYHDDDFGDNNFLRQDDEESERNNESEDSLERLNYERRDIADEKICGSTAESDAVNLQSPITTTDFLTSREASLFQRKDELDKTLLSIEGSVDLALKRTKIWSKYSKDLLTYIERRSNNELEYCRQISKLAAQTRTSVTEESYLPLQSIFVTALEHDIEFHSNFHQSYHSDLQQIVERLGLKQKEHDIKRSKIKTRWKAEQKKQHDSVESLKNAKKLYVQKEKELEKFNKQLQEGKDEKGFSIGKKKGQEDFQKGATESEEQYKKCVDDANHIQAELERTKAEVLLQFRQLIFECDLVMKEAALAYFEMMNLLISPLPVQYRALRDSSKEYEEGQQFSDYVRLQQGTCNQATSPRYFFEPYKPDNKYSFHRPGGDQADLTSLATTLKPRTQSNTSDNFEFPKSPSLGTKKGTKQQGGGSGTWGQLGRQKGSATDDTDSLSSHSLPGSPQNTPPKTRRSLKLNSTGGEVYSDEHEHEHDHVLSKEGLKPSSGSMSNQFKNRKISAAAEGHKFRRLHAPSKCKECESYVYFNGQECEQCGIICHKKCLETLAIKCGNKRLPRKMTTFGVDFMQHLASTQRTDIPYIIEKCVNTIDECGLGVKGIYRVSGVKSKVEKLCQCFETGGDLVDLSDIPPHFIASVLKLYLRQLPEPLLTFKLYHPLITVGKDSMNLPLGPEKIDCMNPEEALHYEDIIRQMHDIIKELPEPNFYTAAKVIRHLRRVADNQEENQMGAGNLAIVFGPTLLRPEGNANSLAAVMDMPHQSRSVELLILNSHMFSHTKEGEIDIETLTGEKRRAPCRKRHGKRGRIDTVPEANDELPEDNEANVAQEFTTEILNSFSMDDIPRVETSFPVKTGTSSPVISGPSSPLEAGVCSTSLKEEESIFPSNDEHSLDFFDEFIPDEPVATVQAMPIIQSIPVTKATSILEAPVVVQATTVEQATAIVQTTPVMQSTPTVHTPTASQVSPSPQSCPSVEASLTGESSPPTQYPTSTAQSKPIDIPSTQSTITDTSITSSSSDSKAVPIPKPQAPTYSGSGDYDNIPGLESDILNDDLPPEHEKVKSVSSNQSASSISSSTDADSVYSRFTSIESLLMGDNLSFGSSPTHSTSELPIATLDQEDSDDAWMNKFHVQDTVALPSNLKEPLTKTTSSSVLETKSSSIMDPKPEGVAAIAVDPFSYPVRKKKNCSLSRIETTSYSFSLGNSLKDEVECSESHNETDLSAWVKRDSKDRVPVRKHLKCVNIKAAVNVSSSQLQTESPTTSPFGLKVTPFTLLESKAKPSPDSNTSMNSSVSEDDDNPFTFDTERNNLPLLGLDTQLDEDAGAVSDGQLSPSKRAPAVLPKPKKHLDKKSWTADLVKSKSQTMADQPQPGSLNDKLLSINRRKTEEKGNEPGISRTSPSRSIKEIRTNFTEPTFSSRNTSDLDVGSNEELSKSLESGILDKQNEKSV